MIYFKLNIISYVTTPSMIRQNMYDIKIFWLIGLILEMRKNWPSFSMHTDTVK